MDNRVIQVPRYYKPWPHQVENWQRQLSGKYTYYVKLWSRQAGKSSFDVEYALYWAWCNRGKQQVYIGLDNGWVNNNIFKKYIDGRTFWMDYPEDLIEVKDTQKEIRMLNNQDGDDTLADSRIKFLGFLNDQALIGSSYDRFTIEEMSLYPREAFRYIEPIWENKKAMGVDFEVGTNFTPRGIKNVAFDMLQAWTGVDDPDEFPGEHITKFGSCYVDLRTIEDIYIIDDMGDRRRLYSDERLEDLRQRHVRQYGNDNLFRQEFYCDFLTVNAGLVYPATEILIKEKRIRKYNINTAYPVFFAFDIGGKKDHADPTTAVVYQYYHGSMFVYDYYEARGKSLVEAISEITGRGYSHFIRAGFLPWDADNASTMKSAAEEAREAFPNIEWVILDRESVERGIQYVREEMPNMIINDNENCDRLVECLLNYEYKRSDLLNDWGKVLHNEYSHGADGLRYAVAGLRQAQVYDMLDVEKPQVQSWGGYITLPETMTGPRQKTESDKVKEFWGGI